MYRKYKFISLFFFSSVIIVCCKKETNGTFVDCNEFNSIKIDFSKKEYFMGETIQLGATILNLSGVSYSWSVPGKLNQNFFSSNIDITNCIKVNEGMYYLTIRNKDCGVRIDSVYITVTNQGLTAQCLTVSDSIKFSAMPSSSYSVTKSYNSPGNRLNLKGTSNQNILYPDFRIMFINNYWNNREPEDGYYFTSNLENFVVPDNIYVVHISSIYNGIYMASADYDTVYVSHINNKLQVSFCNVNLAGTNGINTFRSTAKGRLIEP